jgi:hypothetical protein
VLLVVYLLLWLLSASKLLPGPSAAAVRDSRDLASEFLKDPSQPLLLLLLFVRSVGVPGSFSGSPSACRSSLFTAEAAGELLLALLADNNARRTRVVEEMAQTRDDS